MLRAAPVATDENAGPRIATVGKQDAADLSSGLVSLKGPPLSFSASNVPAVGKQAAPHKPARRALGDITNAQRKAPTVGSNTLKPYLVTPAPQLSSSQPPVPGTHMAVVHSLSGQYAADIDKLAGKPWAQHKEVSRFQQLGQAAILRSCGCQQ